MARPEGRPVARPASGLARAGIFLTGVEVVAPGFKVVDGAAFTNDCPNQVAQQADARANAEIRLATGGKQTNFTSGKSSFNTNER
jgi:hypothetical protein